MKFSDMLISLTGATSRERAIEELAWKSNIYAQEAEKLVYALDKLMPDGAWVILPEYNPPAHVEVPRFPVEPLEGEVDLHNMHNTVPIPSLPWQTWGDAEQQLQAVVNKLPILDGLAIDGSKRTSLADVLNLLQNKEHVEVYGVITDAINDSRITRWEVKTIVTVIMAWLGEDFFTREMPHKFDAVESMRSIVQQSERHIGATRNTLIRAIVLKAMDDGHHVLPTLLECAQISAKQLKEKSDAQA